MTILVLLDTEMSSGTGSWTTWSKLGAMIAVSGSCGGVTGTVLRAWTSVRKPSKSYVKGAPRLLNASSASENVERTALE